MGAANVVPGVSGGTVAFITGIYERLINALKSFDFKAIKEAMEDNRNGRKIRGASTISQQTAKNVFLYPGRTWFRKGLEAYFTFLIEIIWGKERIILR